MDKISIFVSIYCRNFNDPTACLKMDQRYLSQSSGPHDRQLAGPFIVEFAIQALTSQATMAFKLCFATLSFVLLSSCTTASRVGGLFYTIGKENMQSISATNGQTLTVWSSLSDSCSDSYQQGGIQEVVVMSYSPVLELTPVNFYFYTMIPFAPNEATHITNGSTSIKYSVSDEDVELNQDYYVQVQCDNADGCLLTIRISTRCAWEAYSDDEYTTVPGALCCIDDNDSLSCSNPTYANNAHDMVSGTIELANGWIVSTECSSMSSGSSGSSSAPTATETAPSNNEAGRVATTVAMVIAIIGVGLLA